MRLAQELARAVGAVTGLQLLTVLATIGLLHRMSPAIEQILDENVYSLEAAEEMLVVVAGEAPAPPDRRARFGRALARAQGNVTEPEEVPLLDRIERDHAAALAGDRGARQRVVEDLSELAAVNRTSMVRADRAAQDLGMAGAWAAAMLGVLTFIVSQAMYRRLRLRMEAPLVALDAALEAFRRGDPHRRCARLGGPHEVERIRSNANWLMDERAPGAAEARADQLQTALVGLLDQRQAPALLVAAGRVLAANDAALEAAPDVGGWAGDAGPEGWTRHELRGDIALWVRDEGASGASGASGA